MSTQLNGLGQQTVAQSGVSSEIERHASELEALLVPLRAERDQLRARLSELQGREKALAQAVGALRGNSAPAQPKAKHKPPSAYKRYVPSEERLKFIFDLMLKEPEPISPTQLSDKTEGIAVSTVTDGFKILRERELIRKTAALRGGGGLFAVMPGAEWPES